MQSFQDLIEKKENEINTAYAGNLVNLIKLELKSKGSIISNFSHEINEDLNINEEEKQQASNNSKQHYVKRASIFGSNFIPENSKFNCEEDYDNDSQNESEKEENENDAKDLND